MFDGKFHRDSLSTARLVLVATRGSRSSGVRTLWDSIRPYDKNIPITV